MTNAKVYKRIVAIIIDFGLFILVFIPMTYLIKGVWIMSATDHLFAITDPICIFFFCLILLYFIVLEKIFGQTLGKRIMKIKMISQKREAKLTYTQIIVRLLLLSLDSFLFGAVGYIAIATSPNQQRIGDRLAKTIVVDCD